jgi:glutathione S-transferase
VNVKLYVVPGSHPCAVVEAALRLKSIDYQRVDLIPLTQLAIGPLRYGGTTVPGMRIDGERLVDSRAILRRLDAIVAEPALLPKDPDARSRVLEAEEWGYAELQSVPRRMLDVVFLRRPRVMESYADGYRLPLPVGPMRPVMPLTARLMARRNKASEHSAQADLADLPGQLDRIDAWIAEGVLGGEQPNAADLQIGSSIRLLYTVGDLRPLLDGRPSLELRRYFPPMAGDVPVGILPAEWLPQSPSTATSTSTSTSA